MNGEEWWAELDWRSHCDPPTPLCSGSNHLPHRKSGFGSGSNPAPPDKKSVHRNDERFWKNNGGQSWIRTSVGVSQQIYSLPPLATRASTHPRSHGGAILVFDLGTDKQKEGKR